jgi:hypothetical protein
MFYKIDNKNVVNLEDISYIAVDKNLGTGLYDLRIFLKQVEHYMYVSFALEEDALIAFNKLFDELNK